LGKELAEKDEVIGEIMESYVHAEPATPEGDTEDGNQA